MWDWLCENWPILLAAFCYIVGKVDGISPKWKALALAVMEWVEKSPDPQRTAIKLGMKRFISRAGFDVSPKANGSAGVLSDALSLLGDKKHAPKKGAKAKAILKALIPFGRLFIKG